MKVIFIVAVFFILYPHVIYPALLYVLRRKSEKPRHGGAVGPVAIVCSVYNEEKVIASKIRNFYSLDYRDVELYLGLDGCTDGTLAEIRRTQQDDRVKVFVLPRGGKVSVINRLLGEVQQPYVVMTDANSMFRPDAVRKLLAHLTAGVGVVCGRLALIETGHSGEGIYWRIETFVKQVESQWGSVVGANGAIYLLKRNLFDPLPADTINDDFSISMRIFEKGYAVVYAEDAVAEEQLVTTDAEEFKRHIRDAAGHFRALAYHWRLLNPLRAKRFFFYLSHRVIRWLGPFFLIMAFVSNLMLLKYPVYGVLFSVQCLGYVLVVAVHALRIRWKPLYVPYYFMLVNTAIMLGFFRNVLGLQKATWKTTRR